MTDLIREAAERAAVELGDDLTSPTADIIEAEYREKFTGAGLEVVLPCAGIVDYCLCFYRTSGTHSATCSAFYRPAVTAWSEARVAAARRDTWEKAVAVVAAVKYAHLPRLDGDWWQTACDKILEEFRALSSSEPGNEVSK